MILNMIKAQTSFTAFDGFIVTKATTNRIKDLHSTLEEASIFAPYIRLNVFKEEDKTVTFELFDIEDMDVNNNDMLENIEGVNFVCAPEVSVSFKGVTLDYNPEKDVFFFIKQL